MDLIYNKDLTEAYLKETLNYEGGYSNDPDDLGKETCRGITIGALNRAKSQGLVPKTLVVKDLMTDLVSVRKIYDINYYKAGKCNELPHPLAFAHFDACVNHGLGGRNKAGHAVGAGAFLQKTLIYSGYNVKLDGSVGPITLGVLKECLKTANVEDMVTQYNNFREEYFNNIVKNNPVQKKFLKGWLKRLNNVRLFCSQNNGG